METPVRGGVTVAGQLVIVDYGMGNLWSVLSALQYLGAKAEVSSEPAAIALADVLILPGVGSFRKAMEALRLRRLADSIYEAVSVRGRKILGICLGMQLLAESGTEDGDSAGFGFLPTSVDRFSKTELGALKVPHIGFNHVHAGSQTVLFRGLASPSDFYFVHSYRLLSDGLPGIPSLCNYGIDFLAAYEHENVFATQFHPEKSQTNGLRVLSNFLAA